MLLPVLVGVVVGVAWWVLAPTAAVVRLPGGSLVAPRVPELGAAQDGVLLLLGAAAGLACGLGLALRPGGAPVRRSLAVLLGCALGSALAWRLGAALGSPPVHEQLAAHVEHLVSPLQVHSTGVLLVWPVVTAFVAAAGHLAAGWRQRAPEDEPWRADTGAGADAGAGSGADAGAAADAARGATATTRGDPW